MKQPEFTIEQIREFVKKGYQSVSARYVRAALQHIEQLQKPIDAVTVENLDVALRMCQIAIHTAILDKVIRVIKVIQDLGGDISMRDISRLEAEWRASITPDLCCGIYVDPVLGVGKIIPVEPTGEIMPKKEDPDYLNSVRFFDLMQQYRIAPMTDQERVINAFDAVKHYLKECSTRKTYLSAEQQYQIILLLKGKYGTVDVDEIINHLIKDSSNRPQRYSEPLSQDEQIRLVQMLTTRYNVDELNELTLLLIKDRNGHLSAIPDSQKTGKEIQRLPEYNEVYYHAKALSMDEFREYWDEAIKGKVIPEAILPNTEEINTEFEKRTAGWEEQYKLLSDWIAGAEWAIKTVKERIKS